MPIDAFAATGISPGSQQVNNPVDAFAATGITPAFNASPFMSGIAGFNKQFETLPATLAAGGDELAHLIDPDSTPNNTQAVNNFYNQRAQQYQQIANQNPISGGIGKAVGNVAASLPAYAAAGLNVPANFAAGAWTGYSQSNPDASPYEKLFNAAAGGATSAGLSLIPFGIGKAATGLQIQQYAENLLKNIGDGNSLEANGQSLAQDIKNAFEQKQAEGKALYDPVFSKYSNNSIYPLVNPEANSQYLNLDNSITDNFSNRNLNKLHEAFIDSPTLQNAHNLQSQLGTAIRGIQNTQLKGNGSVADNLTMQGYQEAQSALKGDMNSFLGKVDPQAAQQYSNASQNWAQNVTPYLANPKLAQIAKGDITNPRTVAGLFQNPEPEMQQVVEDIGPQANNKILYSELGKTQANLTPESLMSAFNSLDKKGLSSYVTPSLADQFQALAAKSSAKNSTQNLLGAAIGSHFGGVPGAVAGAYIAPKLSNSINSPLVAALMKYAGKGTLALPSIATPYGLSLLNNAGGQ
jgi:hypothetical protein